MSRVTSDFQSNALATHAVGAVATVATATHRLALLLDVSVSMEAGFAEGVTRLEAMRQAVLALLASTNRRDTVVALLTFSSDTKLLVPYTPNFDDMRALKYKSDYSTDMASGIAAAVGLDPSPERVVLLSDGAPDSVSLALQATGLAQSAGVVIDTVAIGAADEKLLRRIAELTGGVFSRAATPTELRTKFVALAPPNRLLLEKR